jgi:magnesium transporter
MRQLGEFEMTISANDPEKKQLNLKTITWGEFTWVDIVKPTEETTKYLAEHYNFHPMDLEDALSLRQLSKVEEYPQYLFVIFHLPVYDKATQISTRKQWSAFVGDKFLVTLHTVELKSTEELFHECEFSEEARQEYFSQGSGYLLYQILDRALDAYFPVLDKIMSMTDDIEDNVFSEGIEAAQELSILRRDIITQRRVMFPTRTLLVELEKKIKRFSKIDLTLYFSDLMDHMNKICETLDESTDIIEVFKDADYLLSSYRANRGIRVLVVMLAILLPIIIVLGLYGIYSIFFGGISKGSPQIFFALIAVIVVFIGAVLYFLRHRHLI